MSTMRCDSAPTSTCWSIKWLPALSLQAAATAAAAAVAVAAAVALALLMPAVVVVVAVVAAVVAPLKRALSCRMKRAAIRTKR